MYDLEPYSRVHHENIPSRPKEHTGPMSILPLPDAVRQQIKSSIQITTLSDVVEELLKNSLDANATTIEIEVDFAKGFCSLQDDGAGIPPYEFSEAGNLARPNCTSKVNSTDSYGHRGCFLSHLSSLSLTSIASKQKHGHSTSSNLLGQSTVLSRHAQTDGAELGPCGSRVVVHNLFGNIPVRFKHLASRYAASAEEDKAFENLKRRLVAYLLASAKDIHLRLRTRNRRLKYSHRATIDNDTPTTGFAIRTIENIFRQAGFADTSLSTAWRLASAKAGAISIRAAICLLPSPSKHFQFISIGHLPVFPSGAGSIFYEMINDVFNSSRFGAVEELDPAKVRPATRIAQGYDQAKLKGKLVKGVDRWPRLFIKIDAKLNTARDVVQRDEPIDDEVPPALQAILDLLKTLLVQFLRSQNLIAKTWWPSGNKMTSVADRPGPSPSVYDNWKRLKQSSSHKHAAHHGLPFTTQDEPAISDIVLGDDVRLLLGDMLLDPEASGTPSIGDDQSSLQLAHGHQMNEATATWMDPSTGQLLHIDSDNGFIMPNPPSSDFHSPSTEQAHNCTTPHELSRLSSARLSRAELAQRLKNWSSSAFQSTRERTIPSVAYHHQTSPIINPSTSVIDQSLTAAQLANAVVLRQVDTKFVLAMVPTQTSHALILVDQHAADERVKVEGLYQQLESANAVSLAKPIKFEVAVEEQKLLSRRQEEFSHWSIKYNVAGPAQTMTTSTITVTHLPAIIAERCRLEPNILIDLLRREIWSPPTNRRMTTMGGNESWVSKISSCPQGLLEMVNSRACRTAVMFNDVLSREQCEGILRNLARCVLPFQCAHGRPSLVVLATLGRDVIGGVDEDESGLWAGAGQVEEHASEKNKNEDFGEAWRRWGEREAAT